MSDELREPVRRAVVMTVTFCAWTLSDDDDNVWCTECDHAFQFTTDGPHENNFKFCPYCGGIIHERRTDRPR